MPGPIGLPDRYRLDGLIATGGMAAVYAAHDTILDRPVAVKVLAEHLTEDPDARARFEREARAAAALSGHPAVVTIYDVGEHEGRSFIVMERRMGSTVAHEIKRGPVERERALSWLRDIAEVLDAAHDRGIVHRDIKPGNLLLNEQDRVAVADFGIATLASEAERVTQTGEVLGTGAYLAPEQAEGNGTSASDRYALACVAYELLTGDQPFAARGFAAQLRAHAEDPPPAAPDLPPAAQEVLQQGLAKRPEQRWATATAFARALTHALEGAEDATRAQPRGPAPMPVPPVPLPHADAPSGSASGLRPPAATPPVPAAGDRAAFAEPPTTEAPRPDGTATRRPPPPPAGAVRARAGATGPPASEPLEGDAPPPEDRRRRLPIAVAVLGALLLAIAIGVAVSGGDEDAGTNTKRADTTAGDRRDRKPKRTPTPEPVETAIATPVETATPAPTPTPTATEAPPEPDPPGPADGGPGDSGPGGGGPGGGGPAPSGSASELNAEGYARLRGGDAVGAVDLLQGAVDACGGSGDLDPCGYAYYNLGIALLESGAFDGAADVLQIRLARWPTDQRGTVKQALKRACQQATC